MKSNLIPTDADSIFAKLSTLESAAIVRPNDPPAGISGFLFGLASDEYLELVSEITDNWLEDNTAIADNIALLPEKVTLRGMIAELTDRRPLPGAPQLPAPSFPLFPALFPDFGLAGAAGIGAEIIAPPVGDAIVASVMGELRGTASGFTEELGAKLHGAVRAIAGRGAAPDAIAGINGVLLNALGPADAGALGPLVGQCVNASVAQVAGSASPGGGPSSLFEYYSDRAPAGTSAQELALGFFYQMWRGRQLCSVETAWGVMTNMAILSCRPEQPEESREITNFTVTFKKVRFAGAATVNLGQLAGRNAIQATADAPAPNGNVGQTPVPQAKAESWLRALGVQNFAPDWLAPIRGP